ncbi:MAG: HD domain-containing protein [Treponema sp.]|nr:HD domain-containing protein [Treponema sp.]
MKKSVSISAIVVIFLAELAGILGIVYLRYCMDFQKKLFDSTVGQVSEIQSDVEQIKSLLYKYEYNMVLVMTSPALTEDETLQKLSETEIEIRNQLLIHGSILQRMEPGTEKEALFRSVNDDTLKYLNFNVVLLSMKGVESASAIGEFTNTCIIPLMDRVNASIDTLSEMTKTYIVTARAEMESYITASRLISSVGFAVIIIAIIMSIIYSHRVLSDLEENNRFFRSKSEAGEQRISEIQNNTIMGIADLVESRSGETGQHVKRTSRLVNMILLQAKKKGVWADVLTDEFIDCVTRAAPMHDLGKIVIPDAILNKPGKLSPEEFEIMKKHAAAGGKIVHDIIGGVADKEYVDIAADIASCHHEKWNGKGYPAGKKGSEIPLCARVMAVADVFDALVSERCYKKPMSYEDAFALIEREAGEHFDPQVAALFLELKDKIYAER